MSIADIFVLQYPIQSWNWTDFFTDLPIPLLLILSLQQLDMATLCPGNFVVLAFALRLWSMTGPQVEQYALNSSFYIYCNLIVGQKPAGDWREEHSPPRYVRSATPQLLRLSHPLLCNGGSRFD